MTDVSCQTGVELLMDYLEGVVPDDMRTILESHVAGCPKCAAFVASYLATPRILREATAAAMPPELQRSLLAFLRAQRGDVWTELEADMTPSSDSQSGVKRLSERHVPRVAGQCRPHLARHVGVTDTGLRIRKAHCAAGSRRPERARAAEPPVLRRLHEAQ